MTTAPSYGKSGTVDHGFTKVSMTVNGEHAPSEDGKSFLPISDAAIAAACGVGCIDHANIDSIKVKSAITDMGDHCFFVGSIKGHNGEGIPEPVVTPRCHVLDGSQMMSGHFAFSSTNPSIDQIIPLHTAENRRQENLAAAYRGAVMADDVGALKSGDTAAISKGILCVENRVPATGKTDRKYLIPVDASKAGGMAKSFNSNREDEDIVFFDDKYHPSAATVVDATSDGGTEGVTNKYVVVSEDDHNAHKKAVMDLLTPTGVVAKMGGLGISTMASDPEKTGMLSYNIEINRTPIAHDTVMAPELSATQGFHDMSEEQPRVDITSLKEAFNAGGAQEQAPPAAENTIRSLFGPDAAGSISVVTPA